jgi:hypothetical protein
MMSHFIHIYGVNGQATNGRDRSPPMTIQWWSFEKLSWCTVLLGPSGPNLPLGFTIHSCNQSIIIDS